jgi:hypothetical protein
MRLPCRFATLPKITQKLSLASLHLSLYLCHRYLLPTYESDPLLTAVDDGEDNDDTDINLPDEVANSKYLHQAANKAGTDK